MSHNFPTLFNQQGVPVVGACTHCGRFRDEAILLCPNAVQGK